MRVGVGIQLTRQMRRSPGEEPPPGGFDPTSYPGFAGWFDARDLSALADDDPVDSWGLTGGAIGTQTGSARPVKKTAAGIVYLEFDNTDDHLVLDDTLTLGGAHTYYVILRKRLGAPNARILVDGNTIYPFLHYGTDWYHGDTTVGEGGALVWARYTLRTNSGVGKRWIDGVQVSTVVDNSASSQSVATIGASAGGACDLALIGLYTAAHSDEVVAAIEAEMAGIVGL